MRRISAAANVACGGGLGGVIDVLVTMGDDAVGSEGISCWVSVLAVS